jgi:hypothetical protein
VNFSKLFNFDEVSGRDKFNIFLHLVSLRVDLVKLPLLVIDLRNKGVTIEVVLYGSAINSFNNNLASQLDSTLRFV